MYSLMRLGSVLVVAGLKLRCAPSLYLSCYYSILFCHFILGFAYSRRRLAAVAGDKGRWLSSLGLAAACQQMISHRFPSILVYSTLHHSSSDVYTATEGFLGKEDPAYRRFVAARLGVILFSYMVLYHASAPFSAVDVRLLYAGLIASAGCFLAVHVRRFERASAGAWIDQTLFEAIGVGVCVWASRYQLRVVETAFYHVTYWFLLTLRGQGRSGGGNDAGYAALTAAVTLGVFAFTPEGWLGRALGCTHGFWGNQAEIWAYVHITSTLAVSRFNPGWIVRCFQPDPSPVIGRQAA